MRRNSSELQVELRHWWRQFKLRGDDTARTRLIEHYRYLVVKTRQRIIPTVPVRIAPEDLDQEGTIALVRSVEQFDLNRRVKFESYAISSIRGAMLEYLRREDWVPRSVRDRAKRLRAAEEAAARRVGPENVTEKHLADELELPIDAFYELYAQTTIMIVVSMDDLVGDSEQDDLDPLLVLESVKSREPDPFQAALVSSQKEMMARCIRWLPAQERTVVQLYYFGGWTLKQIAREMGRSESRAHQLHAQAIQRLTGFIARQRGLYFPEVLPHPEDDFFPNAGDAEEERLSGGSPAYA